MFNSHAMNLRYFILKVAIGLIFSLSLSIPSVAQEEAGQSLPKESSIEETNNLGTALWTAVRQNNLPTKSQVDTNGAGPIYTDGLSWLRFRDEHLIPKAVYLFGGTVLILFLFWLIRRSIAIPGGASGKRILRSSTVERFIHWVLAGSFILLAISGFLLMYGRTLLVPVLGAESSAWLVGASNTVHYWMGFVFPIAIILMFFKFVRRNLYEKGDLKWLLKGGGIITDDHISAGFYNMGEKILFWLVIIFGVALSASGLIMEFQLLELTRTEMLIMNSVHGIVAAIFTAIIFGHIYLATIGVKGTLSAMTDGRVDENWAKAHHDRWFDEVQASQKS